MIELKRLKLINWHNFENTTFDCARLTYMIGVNAVGKTTILDAINNKQRFITSIDGAHTTNTDIINSPCPVGVIFSAFPPLAP